MLRALRSLWGEPASPSPATDAYIALLHAARNPFFFNTLRVPDSIDGRFELIVLHLVLLQQRLAAHTEFSRALAEAFFDDMERAIREMGVMDPGVGKRVKKMANAYQGRCAAYGTALADTQGLKAALARNLYGTVEDGDVQLLDHAEHYVRALVHQLSAADDAVLLAGAWEWPAPESL